LAALLGAPSSSITAAEPAAALALAVVAVAVVPAAVAAVLAAVAAVLAAVAVVLAAVAVGVVADPLACAHAVAALILDVAIAAIRAITTRDGPTTQH
jgi:hypothetical protein